MSLSGKKTYLIAGGVALAAAAHALGWIDDVVYQAVLGLLGAGGLATLRAGVTKSGPIVPSIRGEFPGLDAGGPGVKEQ